MAGDSAGEQELADDPAGGGGRAAGGAGGGGGEAFKGEHRSGDQRDRGSSLEDMVVDPGGRRVGGDGGEKPPGQGGVGVEGADGGAVCHQEGEGLVLQVPQEKP